ncbi:Structural maintenance of chromosomes protein 5 [Saxophila tyrrhenica]|uniref:Structural maintenance of chromosomes protein 5 n=1 Tax=Saxophila tyrrhenica TaxID=1690608 RepID=A0AAV9PRT6_9PEZI|nr:Structural maintenance of chromosomes protein 5 [Saxophila tyrrhenica]
MSGSVTPARRPREEDDSDIEDFEPSVDGEGSARSTGRKRARVGDDYGEEDANDDSESERGSLLPDSFRRSPKTTGRGVDLLNTRSTAQKHQPGSIVRVTLTNFVTYTKAEFHPGPNLNMIIGPNGTGKSTLVCAICLGLGWGTVHLGRAKDLGEFVKHGAKRAEIEIELAKDPARHEDNPVITTRITKDGNKAEFAIDQKKSNKKGVQQLARSFSIQVDNLCQFLPQDRVVEFAGLSPEALLVHTQRAAAPEHMSEWHDSLKDMRKEQRSQQQEQQKLLESLKQDEGRQRLQEADVIRMRERSELQQRQATLEKLRPFPKYAAAVARHLEAKNRKKEAERELRRLEARLQPNLHAVQAKEAYHERVGKVVSLRQRLAQRQEGTVSDNRKKIVEISEKIDDCTNEIQTEKQNNKAVHEKANRLKREISALQRHMENPPEPFDPAEMNERNRELTRRIREITDGGREIQEEIRNLNGQARQRQTIVEQCQKDRESLQSQAGQQANKLRQVSRDAAVAWDWIQTHRDQFKGEVYGPPIIECTMKDSRNASAVESVVQDGEKLAFTVTTQEDFDMLNRQLYTTMKLSKINIRASIHALSTFDPPLRSDDLRQYGLECWVVDLIEGPDAVLAMLCDNSRLHQTAFTARDITDAQYEALKRTSLSSWVTASNTYQIARRREYGEQATSTRVNPLKPARYFTDAPVDRQHEDELNAREREAKGEIGEIRQKHEELKTEGTGYKERLNQLREEQKRITEEKEVKQRQHSEFNGLPAKEQRAQEQLRNAQQQIDGSLERRRRIVERGDNLTVSKGQLVLDYANSVEALRGLHVQLYEAEILQLEAKSDLDQLQAQHAEEQRLLQERTDEVAQLTEVSRTLLEAGRRLQVDCRGIGEDLNDAGHEVLNEVVTEGKWTEDQLETEIESVTTRIQLTSGNGNQNTIREFEERASRIETKCAKLRDIEAHLRDLFNRIEELRGKWEPKLDELVAQISEAFAENFTRIQSAGEVAVHKDDDFEQWAIQIKVKFRENEQLSVLDSHRQSGGERAVSTIFYLMALQSLARAPFRVVDEINQGMDPRNERLVHSRMVEIACAEHTSQYFLITPKLLNGLTYHPNMKVHCIASGEYMPSDHRELDFAALAQKALAVRRGGNVEVAG